MATTTQTEIVGNYGHFQWGAVFAGSAIALGISIVFLQFGTAIGLSDDSPLRGEGNIASWGVIATVVWILWAQLLASLAGGYAAGYLRSPVLSLKDHQNELKDGLYGFVVWAFSTVLVFIGMSLAAFAANYVSLQAGTYEAADTLSDTEQNASIIYAFSAGAISLLSAVAAWWAATMGGEHKRKAIDFSTYLSFKKK